MTPSSDYLIAIAWFIATAILVLAAWLCAKRLFPRDSMLTRLAHAIVIAWANIVAVSVILGTLGFLHPAALLIGVAGVAVVMALLVRRYLPARDNALDSLPSPSDGWLWGSVWAIVFAFWGGHIVTSGLLRFPDDWDTLMYHLPLVDHWLQARSLYAPDGLRWSDPGNNELITLWLVAPFSGDFLNALTNLPSALLLACASIELGRQLGLSNTWRNLAALAVVTNFVVFKQLIDTENDVAVAALLVACFASTLRYADRGRPADLLLTILSLGLLAGIKFYALGYAAVAGACAFGLIARRRGVMVAVRSALWGGLGVLLLGSYWYIRNAMATGSPFFPMQFTGNQDDLTDIYPGSVWATTFLGNRRPELWELGVAAVWGMTGPCHWVALLGLPVTLGWLIVSGCRHARHRDGAARLGLAFATVASGLVLLITPFAVEDVPGSLNQMHWKYCPVRYGIAFLSLAVIGLVVVLDELSHMIRLRAGRWLSAICTMVLVVGLIVQAVQQVREVNAEWLDSLLIGVNLALLGWIVLILIGHFRLFSKMSRFKWIIPMSAVILFLIISIGVDQLSERWHAGYARFYDRMLGRGLFGHLNQNERAGTAICVLDWRAYPFFGSARQFRLCQVSGIRSYDRWRAYLMARNVETIVIRLGPSESLRRWANAPIWIGERPREFNDIGNRSWPYAVYQPAWQGVKR